MRNLLSELESRNPNCADDQVERLAIPNPKNTCKKITGRRVNGQAKVQVAENQEYFA